MPTKANPSTVLVNTTNAGRKQQARTMGGRFHTVVVGGGCLGCASAISVKRRLRQSPDTFSERVCSDERHRREAKSWQVTSPLAPLGNLPDAESKPTGQQQPCSIRPRNSPLAHPLQPHADRRPRLRPQGTSPVWQAPSTFLLTVSAFFGVIVLACNDSHYDSEAKNKYSNIQI